MKIIAVLALTAALSAPVVYGQIENSEECPSELPEELLFLACAIDFTNCRYEPEDAFCCPETGECATLTCFCGQADCCAFCNLNELQEECPSVTESCPTERPENMTDFCFTNDLELEYTCPTIVTSDCCPETGECLEVECSCSGTSSGRCYILNDDIECPSLCPAEEPEDFTACDLADGFICSFEPDESDPPACFEEFTSAVECECSDISGWFCFNRTEINLDPSCGPIEQLCPADPPIENDFCDIPSFVDCSYETADFCCPETGICTEIEYYCSSFSGWTVSRPLGLGGDGICPSLCPADALEATFNETCVANGFRYDCFYEAEDEEACCPETGECALEQACFCGGDEGFCYDGAPIFCPAQFLCPEEPPQEGTVCTGTLQSEYLTGGCTYDTPNNPECFEEVVRQYWFCDFSGEWGYFERQGPLIDETCDFTPSVLTPSAVIAPVLFAPSFPTMPMVTPVQAPAVAPTLTAECDDDKFAKFFVEETGKEEPCVWLAARMDTFSSLCDEGSPSEARSICKETCGVCDDSCEDTDGTFEYDGVDRPCLWLSLRNWIIVEPGVCDGDAGSVCPETCDTCDTFV